MTFNLLFLTFVAFFLSMANLIWTSKHYDPAVIKDFGDFLKSTEINTLDNVSGSSTSASSGNKRPKAEMQTSKEGSERYRKYHNETKPLNIQIDESMMDSIEAWEMELLPKKDKCIWEKFNNVSKQYAKALCIEVWKIQVPKIPEIHSRLQDGMIPDCETSVNPGPSKNKKNYRSYKGFFQFLKYGEFYPDLIRCNCAYLNKVIEGSRTTVSNTKRYFFLYKHHNNVYYVFTRHGGGYSRFVKVVDVQEINI